MSKLSWKRLISASFCVLLVCFSSLAQSIEVRQDLKGRFAPFELWHLKSIGALQGREVSIASTLKLSAAVESKVVNALVKAFQSLPDATVGSKLVQCMNSQQPVDGCKVTRKRGKELALTITVPTKDVRDELQGERLRQFKFPDAVLIVDWNFERNGQPVVDIPDLGLAIYHGPVIVNIDLLTGNMRYGALSKNPAKPVGPSATDALGPKEAGQQAPEQAKEAPRTSFRGTLMNPAVLNEAAPDTFKVRFETNKGNFTVKVTKAWAPKGADRFYNLAKNGFFDNARFFRVLTGFGVQFGLPADPQVAAVWYSAKLRDDPVKQSNKKGTLVFATAGPNTRTTQLFINLVDNGVQFDSQGYAPFGELVEGMAIVQALYSGYGESPDQGSIMSKGNAYLINQFPKLDFIKAAIVEYAAPARSAAAQEEGLSPQGLTGSIPDGLKMASQGSDAPTTSQPTVHTKLQLTKLVTLTRLTTLIMTEKGWRPVTPADFPADESKLKNIETTDWSRSYAAGSYTQSFQGREAKGDVIDLGSATFDDESELPVFVLKGLFFVQSDVVTKQIKKLSSVTKFTVKEEIWKTTDGKKRVLLAEGTGCLLLDPSAIHPRVKEIEDKAIFGIVPSLPYEADGKTQKNNY